MNYRMIRGFLDVTEIEAVSCYCKSVMMREDFREPLIPYFESKGDERRLIRIERLIEDFEVNTGVTLLRRCTELARLELGHDVILFKDKINFRHPGADGFGAHQDAAAGWTKFSPIFHSIAIFARDTDAHHGGFEFSVEDPKSSFYPNINGQISTETFEAFSRCDIVANAGDAIFFDSYAPHRSHTNKSGEIIPHIILTFNPAEFGDRRSDYYESKLAGMKGGKGGYEFALFSFGGDKADGAT